VVNIGAALLEQEYVSGIFGDKTRWENSRHDANRAHRDLAAERAATPHQAIVATSPDEDSKVGDRCLHLRWEIAIRAYNKARACKDIQPRDTWEFMDRASGTELLTATENQLPARNADIA